MAVICTRGLKIAYDRAGQGPPLVFAHGGADEPGAGRSSDVPADFGPEVVVIQDCGHVSNLERPEEFNAAVRAFCRSHPPLDA